MTELQRTIQALMMDPNPMTRLFAIDLLVQNQHRLPPELVVSILRGATNDRDEEVARGAKIAMSKLLQGEFGASDQIREMGINSRMTEISEVERTREYELRRVALELLQPAVTVLRQYVPAHPLAPEALVLLGSLRDPGAIHLIVDAMSSPALKERAFDALQNFQTPEALALVGRLLERETDEKVIGRLADVLGESQTAEAVTLLTKLAVMPSEMVREHVALALGKLPRRTAEPALVAMWERERSQSVQLVLLGSMGRAGRDASVEAIVRKLGSMPDDRVLSKAMMALGQIGLSKAHGCLAGLLPSANPRVRANALEALARLPMSAKDAIELFFPYLGDKNNRVRGNAIVAFYPHDHKRAIEELRKMIASDRALDRATAAWVASQLQSAEAVEALVIMTATELDKMVQSSCLAALAKLRNPRARALLSRLLTHPSPVVRHAAVLAYGRIGGPAVLRELEAVFQQTDHELVRLGVVTAMGSISHQGNLTYLQKKLGDHNEKLALAAIEALDRVGALEVAVMLEPFVAHANPRLRAAAIVALWNLGHVGPIAGLVRLLSARDEGSSRAAFAALDSITKNLSWRELEKRPLLLSALTDRLKDLPARDELALTMSGIGMEPVAQDSTEPAELVLAEAIKAMSEMREDAAAETVKALLLREPANPLAHFLLARLTGNSASRHTPPDEVVAGSQFLYLFAEQLKAAKQEGDVTTLLATHFEIFALHTRMLGQFVEMGRRYLARGDGGGANAIARFIVSQLQWTEDLHRRLGMLYLAEKDYEKAHGEFWKACVNTPDEPGAMLELARSAAGLGKHQLARELASTVLARENLDPRVKAKAHALAEKLG